MGTLRYNTWQNPDGTENFKCRAWVNFDGTGTVAIRASGNVSSITDIAVGQYRVNLTSAMPDANYSVVLTSGYAVGNSGAMFGTIETDPGVVPTASTFQMTTRNSPNGFTFDPSHVFAAVFR